LTSMAAAALRVLPTILQQRRFSEEVETPLFKALYSAGEFTLAPMRQLLECPRLYDLGCYPVLGALERLSSFLATVHDWHALPLLQLAITRVENLDGVDAALKQRVRDWLAKAMKEIRGFHNLPCPVLAPLADP
jgi:hypothetical protein